MSDNETTSNTSKTSKGDDKFAKRKGGIQKNELNTQLKEYIDDWRKTREVEEEELRRLKDKQAKRKELRKEQEAKMNQQKKEEEEKVKKEEAEKKAVEAEEKKKRLAEAETKRQEMLEAQKVKRDQEGGSKKEAASSGAMSDARREMSKTKEQLEEEKNIALSIRVKSLDLIVMDSDELKEKVNELWKIVVQLETDRYDMQQRTVTQDY